MINLKLESKLAGTAVFSLQDMAGAIYHQPGVRVIGIVELAHVERTEPARGEDKDPIVKVAVKAIEVARDDQEHVLREAMAALHRHRTATGTIDEELNPKLSQRTLELTGGALDAIEAARLRIACEQWGEYIDKQLKGSKMTAARALEELRTVREGLAAAITRGAI